MPDLIPGFIENKARDLGLGELDHTVVDTLELARGLYNQLKRYTLDSVCKHLGISLENHHRAVDDAGATAEIFKKCQIELQERKVERLADINPLIRRGDRRQASAGAPCHHFWCRIS